MSRKTELSEHDAGFKLGLQHALNLVREQSVATSDMLDTKREKEAVHRVCDIVRIKLEGAMPK